jgi:hypothetical protein
MYKIIFAPKGASYEKLGQGTHYTLECNQSHRIRRERPKEARHKAPPVPLQPTLTPHSPSSVIPSAEAAFAVIQRPTHRINHETLLNDV